jgi:aryl-alcohol dehydrogenase-like predicted oxidoreductase
MSCDPWANFPGQPPNDAGIEDAWRMFARLQREGKIRHIGVSNVNVPQMERIRAIAPVSSLEPLYSMLMRDVETEILPYCEVQGIGVIVYSPMHAGLLSEAMTRERVAAMPPDDWRKKWNPDFQEPRLSGNPKLVEELRAIGVRHGKSPGEVAIAWTLRLPAVTAAIVGARRAAQVDGFIGAADFRLSQEELAKVEGLLGRS